MNPVLPTNNPTRGFLKKLKSGDYGLGTTFWTYGFLVWFLIATIPWVVLGIMEFPQVVENRIRVVDAFVLWAYLPLVLIGIWKSSGKYQGPRFWALIARIIVVATVLFYWTTLSSVLYFTIVGYLPII